MSWLARSIATSLHLDEDDDAIAQNDSALLTHPEDGERPEDQYPENIISKYEEEGYVEDRSLSVNDDDSRDNLHGLKEDLSEFKETFTRQLWGVASFLAPPPPPPPPPLPGQKSDLLYSESKSERVGLDNEEEEEGELGEYGEGEPGHFGKYSNLSQSEDYYTLEDAVGITEEVLAFARNIAHHPETWLDFPLSEEEEFDDFDLSDAQIKHALRVEHLALRLAALRYELCPAHMSEGYFWMVYFVLLHSRLNKHDADLLSTPQLVQARTLWMQELQKRTKSESDWFGSSTFYSKEFVDSPCEIFSASSFEDAQYGNRSDRMTFDPMMTCQATNDFETEKHPLESNEIQFIDKSVIEEDPASKPVEKEIVLGPSIEMQVQDYDDDDDDDDWLKEDPDLVECSGTMIFGNGEDVSFSDLEDDIDCTIPVNSKIVSSDGSKPTKTS
ncbi:BSD domain-containing protein [Forsythia ovata]|uniref:BSD domain-containing protein n=1 Tax=Forsythia ovata TaxID=205694 RepID=A0ABD1UXR7_9LAMI